MRRREGTLPPERELGASLRSCRTNDAPQLFHCCSPDGGAFDDTWRSLALALDAIHRHGVNLLNIRSYVRDVANARTADVIVTAEGHELDSNLASAIEELSGLAAQVKVFGSFKSADRAVARPYSP